VNVVYTHIPLDRIAMSREEIEVFVAALNDAMENCSFARAVITVDNTLAIDARLAKRLNLTREEAS
jgi:hypothetical protein